VIFFVCNVDWTQKNDVFVREILDVARFLLVVVLFFYEKSISEISMNLTPNSGNDWRKS
jgi:hypothetical protein